MNGIEPPLDKTTIEEGAVALRREGLLDQEIANELGVDYHQVIYAFDRMRRRGEDVPPSPYIRRHRGRPHYSIEDRGWDTACWIWAFPTSDDGYGRITIDGRAMLAHRWYYEDYVAPVPGDRVLHHLCHQRACVNPEHLQVMTRAEHINEHRADLR